MIEGFGSGSGFIPLTNGSGSGSRRPKITWIRWIRIRNGASTCLPVFCPVIRCHLLSNSCLKPVITTYMYMYVEYHSVFPLVGIGTPSPLPQIKRVCPPPPNQRWGGGAHSPGGGREWGSPKSDDWRNSLALCLLCACHVLSSSCQFFREM